MDDKTLEELALQEILKDLKRGAERAKEYGALGWQKNPAPPPNKRFLRNMLVSTLRDKRPFRNRFKPQSQPDSSNHFDSHSERSTKSETRFHPKDRGYQKQDSVDNRNEKRKYPFPEHDYRGTLRLMSQRESRNSGKRQEDCSELTVVKDKDTCDSDEERHCTKKRCTAVIVISDSDVEERNWETKDRKRRKRKHRKVTEVKDSTHSGEKKKHKKSKKSKRHKSETSGHSSKYKL